MRLIFGIAEPHQIEGKTYRCGDTIEVADQEAPKWESLGFHREPEPLPFDDLPIQTDVDFCFMAVGMDSEEGAVAADTEQPDEQAEIKPRRRRNR